jgi:hypothetical protein
MRPDVVVAVTMQIAVFWDVMPHGPPTPYSGDVTPFSLALRG